MSTVGSIVALTARALAPLRERRDLVAGLDLMDRIIVGGPSVLVRPMIQTYGVGASIR